RRGSGRNRGLRSGALIASRAGLAEARAALASPQSAWPRPPRRYSAHWDHDPVLVDLAVDGGPGHSERLGGLDLVPVEVEQALHDGIALHRLQRAQQAAADGAAFWRQVRGLDDAGPPELDNPAKHLP